VLAFMSKKTKIKYVGIGELKDWRDAGYEIEHLGTRLDQARAALAEAKSKWARDYWKTTVDRLFLKWSLTIQLKDTGLKQHGSNGFYANIDYYWWEKSDEIRMLSSSILDNLFHNSGLSARLDESWAKAQEQKVQKARLGLA